MPEEKRRPLGDGAVLLGGERPVPTETPNDPQPGNASDPAIAKARHAKLRSRLAAAADYVPVRRIERELTRAEHLWRACMEIERLESGNWSVEVGHDFSSGR